jgi:hypothetical protein
LPGAAGLGSGTGPTCGACGDAGCGGGAGGERSLPPPHPSPLSTKKTRSSGAASKVTLPLALAHTPRQHSSGTSASSSSALRACASASGASTAARRAASAGLRAPLGALKLKPPSTSTSSGTRQPSVV